MNTAAFPVMGTRVLIESNCQRVLDIAERAFGAWRALESTPEVIEATVTRVRITVEEDASRGSAPPLEYQVQGLERLEIRCGESIGVAETRTQEASATVQESLLHHADHFRHNFLETLVLFLVSARDRQPFHAAAVVDGDVALLLAGPPGVGKSTLMYACMKAGMRVLADDHVNLQSRPQLRIWGMPAYVHLRTEARAFFPELPETGSVITNGTSKVPIALSDRQAQSRTLFVERAGLCLLQRNGNAVRIEALEPAEAIRAATSSLESGFDLFADTIERPLSRLVRNGAWRMTLGESPTAAVPEIARMLELVRRSDNR
jgi:hypothetical protein